MQSLKNLQSQLPTTQDSAKEISIYHGKLTKEELAKQCARILKAFPKMPRTTLDTLKDRFIANNFNDARLIAAVDYVIDNYEGWDKLPNIANFIRYDKKIKTYSQRELMEIHKDCYFAGATYDPIEKEYAKIKLPGIDEPRFVKKEDQIKYGFELFNKQNERKIKWT